MTRFFCCCCYCSRCRLLHFIKVSRALTLFAIIKLSGKDVCFVENDDVMGYFPGRGSSLYNTYLHNILLCICLTTIYYIIIVQSKHSQIQATIGALADFMRLFYSYSNKYAVLMRYLEDDECERINVENSFTENTLEFKEIYLTVILSQCYYFTNTTTITAAAGRRRQKIRIIKHF